MPTPLNRTRLILGFLALPVVSVIIAFVLVGSTGMLLFSETAEIVLFFGVTLALPATILFAPPMLWFYRRKGWERPISFALGGAFVGFVTPPLFLWVRISLIEQRQVPLLDGVMDWIWLSTIPMGICAALLFRYILYGDQSENPSNEGSAD